MTVSLQEYLSEGKPVSPLASSKVDEPSRRTLPNELTDGVDPSQRTDSRLDILAWAALVALLLLNVPFFLRMPVIDDVFHFDICAWIVMDGGVLYRDSFEPSPPGVVWIHMLVRSLFGWSSEAIRFVDLSIMASNIAMLVILAQGLGISRRRRIWLAIALFAFYFWLGENSHCQRDSWMLLPCLAALIIRQRLFLRQISDEETRSGLFVWSVLEGCCWAIGFWIKPFVAVPAAACWAMSVVLLRTKAFRNLRRIALNLLGLATGFSIILALGIRWMYGTGALPYYWNIVTEWLPEYRRLTTLPGSATNALVVFFPWSIVHLVAMPLAWRRMYQAVVARADELPSRPTIGPGALIGVFYVAWWFQCSFLQHGFEYHHVPPILLAFLVGSQWKGLAPRTRIGRLNLGLAIIALILLNPMLRWNRLSSWLECVRGPNTVSMKDRLALHQHTSWVDLEQVANFLRTKNLSDGDLTCHGALTVSLYRELGVKPSTRFDLLSLFLCDFPAHGDTIREQQEHHPGKFVVTDVTDPWSARLSKEEAMDEWPDQRLALPPDFPLQLANHFPWSEPIVFRSGRYFVHQVTRGLQDEKSAKELTYR